jgi:hypothetical protein
MTRPTQKVYISHAPGDREIALELAGHLERDGFLTAGNHSAASQQAGSSSNFYESVSDMRALVILLTPESLLDEHVKRETNIAIENKVPIYPVNLSGEDELKKLLSSEWRYWLSITQILTCQDAREASTKLRFRISADATSSVEEDLSLRESIIGAWRVFESLFEHIGKAKMTHTFIDFQELHDQFDKDVVPGFTAVSRRLQSSDEAYKMENRFAGKMLYGLFNYIQYFDCHSLTIDRSNSCGLKGHEIETLIERYAKFAAISFEYPTAITWFTETQFLWDYQKFTELALPLLKSENFPRYSEVLVSDYATIYSKPFDYGPDFPSWEHKPELTLKAHIFDDLSKYVFYRNLPVLANKNASVDDLKLALSSVDSFLDESGFDFAVLESMASCREEFQMTGYPTLSLFRAYLLKLLGEEDQARVAIENLNASDVPMLKYLLTKSVSASNGTGREILEQLWGFFQKNFEVAPSEYESYEDFVYTPEERSLTVAEQLFLLANGFYEAGDTETALNLWAKSARGGLFAGLASFTWMTLKTGAFDAGLALYEECSELPCDPQNMSEKLNCTGNYLLNLLARDHDYPRAVESFNSLVLQEGNDTTYINHMSLAVLEFRHGDRARAIQIFKSIPSDVLAEINQAYFEESESAEGWHMIWCLEVVMAIRELSLA